MCGRFTLRKPASEIAQHFALFPDDVLSDLQLRPRFNIAPGQPVLLVRADDAPGRRTAALARWGLVPSWAKDPAMGNRLINARSETAPEKPAFRAAFRRRRCLIPADGFYEWQKQNGRKRPHFIRMRDDRLFALAGLWEAWEGQDHSALVTCTILTTEANRLLQPLHDRMPVILAADDYHTWLDPEADVETVRGLMRPFAEDALEHYPVSTLVNRPENDAPQCIAREPQQGELF